MPTGHCTVARGGDPWFVGVDVCRALDVGNSRQAVERLDDDEKDVVTVEAFPGLTVISDDGQSRPGGARSWAIINESGLYSLILTSRKDAAKRFKKWVTGTVLPSLRKHGGYMVGQVCRGVRHVGHSGSLRLVGAP